VLPADALARVPTLTPTPGIDPGLHDAERLQAPGWPNQPELNPTRKSSWTSVTPRPSA